MKSPRLFYFTLFLLAAASPVAAAEPAPAPAAPPTDIVIIDHTKVDAAFAQGMPMLVNSRYKIQAGRRVTGGVVECHDRDTDLFYVLEGSATIVTGGTMVEPTTTGPGEIRAKSITGGTTRKLTKGDIIVIPRGIPHWFTDVTGTFLYHVVKITD